jgi:hypothetical protein
VLDVNDNLDTLFQFQVALMRLELLQLVDVHVEEASRPLREEVAALKLLLARVGDSLELTGGLGHAPVQASFLLDSTEQKSSVVEEEHLYGCISPRGSPCQSPQPVVSATYEREGMDGILDPVLQITPVFHELCEDSSKVLPLEVDSFEALATLSPHTTRKTLIHGPIIYGALRFGAPQISIHGAPHIDAPQI